MLLGRQASKQPTKNCKKTSRYLRVRACIFQSLLVSVFFCFSIRLFIFLVEKKTQTKKHAYLKVSQDYVVGYCRTSSLKNDRY